MLCIYVCMYVYLQSPGTCRRGTGSTCPCSNSRQNQHKMTEESLVNLTRMYPVVDVQLRLDQILLPLSDASSELDSHDVALYDDEQL